MAAALFGDIISLVPCAPSLCVLPKSRLSAIGGRNCEQSCQSLWQCKQITRMRDLQAGEPQRLSSSYRKAGIQAVRLKLLSKKQRAVRDLARLCPVDTGTRNQHEEFTMFFPLVYRVTADWPVCFAQLQLLAHVLDADQGHAFSCRNSPLAFSCCIKVAVQCSLGQRWKSTETAKLLVLHLAVLPV